MSKVAKHIQDKIEVEFTSAGEHVEPGSITLSSFLGSLMREHVSVLLDDWRKLPDQTNGTIWEEIQVFFTLLILLCVHIIITVTYILYARFNLKQDWQRDIVFMQMGCLWRDSKSRLVSKVRDTKSKSQRLLS